MEMRVLIVAEHASAKFGGEAALALHYFRVLSQRGIPTWLLVHERTRQELEQLFPQQRERIIYIRDTIWHLLLWRGSRILPDRLSHFTIGFLLRFITQLTQRRIARDLTYKENISIIHQPMPVSPKEPSLIFNMGVPVIIGPMNGGIDYPPAFQEMQSTIVSRTLSLGRWSANFMNSLMPGKKKATVLLVANERTRQSLPSNVCLQVIELVENGVDLSLWNYSTSDRQEMVSSPTRYVFVGRLVPFKAVNLLLLAFKEATSRAAISLTIIGDGVERANLENQALELGILGSEPDIAGQVFFTGWMAQEKCASELQKFDGLIFPSLQECGGAVILEAMAMGIPVIATDWGGPADYLDPSCGILIEPASKDKLVADFADAMVEMALSPEKRHSLGKSGREKVIQHFDWEIKVDRMMEIYQQAIADYQTGNISR